MKPMTHYVLAHRYVCHENGVRVEHEARVWTIRTAIGGLIGSHTCPITLLERHGYYVNEEVVSGGITL